MVFRFFSFTALSSSSSSSSSSSRRPRRHRCPPRPHYCRRRHLSRQRQRRPSQSPLSTAAAAPAPPPLFPFPFERRRRSAREEAHGGALDGLLVRCPRRAASRTDADAPQRHHRRTRLSCSSRPFSALRTTGGCGRRLTAPEPHTCPCRRSRRSLRRRRALDGALVRRGVRQQAPAPSLGGGRRSSPPRRTARPADPTNHWNQRHRLASAAGSGGSGGSGGGCGSDPSDGADPLGHGGAAG